MSQEPPTFRLRLDEAGFLLELELWTKDIARVLTAEEVPKGLTKEHWKVIDYLRQY